MSTTLKFHMTPNFVQEVTGQPNGMGNAPVWAYLWLDKPPADTPISDVFSPTGAHPDPGATNNTTPLIINGSLTPNVTLVDGYYQVTVSLTDTTYQYVNGGVAYLLLQSEPLAGHTDLPTSIGSSVGNIQPNSQAWNFGYAAFEYSLLGQGSDQGDLTAIDGWGPNLGVKVSYSNGTSEERGSNLTGKALLDLLTPLNSTANHTYTAAGSPLNGDSALFVSPSNGYFNKTASPVWPTTIWDTQPDGTGTGYLTAFAALTDVTLSGVSNGEPDANGIWHNSQYYEYTVSSLTLAANTGTNGWGAAGTYFLFSPSSSSQTKGYMLISAATLQENLYAAGQGTATMWSSWDSATPTNSVPYVIPGSGQPSGTAATDNSFNPSANNQYGTIFTNLFTGFTAGYWGSVANQANPFSQGPTGPDNLGAGSVNLDDSRNWASAYAFDGNRDTTASPVPTYQHYDPYSKIFFENTNVYGSAFSDNLSSGLTPGPLIALSQPGSGSGTSPSNNVTNIDLYVYASNETGNYTEPVGANYLKPLGSDYLIPTQTSGLSVLVNGQAAGLLIREDATIKLGIYTGKNGSGYATFDYVTVDTGGNLWQNFSITGSAGSWSAGVDATDPNAPAVGTFVINDLPAPASPAVGGVYWYQLVVGDDTGDQKVYDFYATAASTSPGVISTSDLSVAAGGGATFPPGTLTSSQIQLALNPASTMPSGLLDFVYNSQFSPMPAAPVAGTLAGLVFTAIDGQNGTGILDTISDTTVTPAILIASASATLAFGWTGTNNGTHSGTPTGSISTGLPTNGLISKFTNKINAGDVARITVVDAATNTALGTTVSGTADLDGQWQTWGGAGPATVTLAEGIYSATMMEMMPDGTTPYGSATGTQSAPLYILVSSTSSYADTAAHISNALVALEALETQVGSPFPVTVSDNGLIAMNYAGIATYANVLLQTTNANSTPYELAISDSSATIVANIASLNSNTHVETIGFTDAGIPTLTFTDADFTAYSTAIGEMVGQRTIVVTGTSGTFSSFEQDYRHGVLSSGANGSGVLVLTREFATNYTGGNITDAPNYEHDTDSMGRTVLDYYSSPVNTNAITVATSALPSIYQSGGSARSTFTTVTYEYANGVTTPASSAYSYFDPGPGYNGYEDVFDVNGNLIQATQVGFNPSSPSNPDIVAKDVFYQMINGVQTTVATGTHYEYSAPQPGTNYTDLVDKWDTSNTPLLLKQVFSGLSGPESNFFSSYEYHYLGGVLSGSKYVLAPVTGQPYTGGEIHLDGDGNLSKVIATGITSQAYSSYEYDFAYANGAYGGGSVVGQKYYFINIEGQSYTTRQVDLDASGSTTKVIYSGYTVTNTQPYSSVEYDYAGGSVTGGKGYVTNIAGQDWTGEVHEFNAAGQLVGQLFTGVTNQTSTSYEFEYANGNGVLTGKNFYFTDVVNQGYSSYEYSYDATDTLTLATYNMNDGGHVLNGQGISQTINSIYNDTMTGGGGSDTFAFTPYFGQAIITDFTSADDIISLPGSEFTNYAYVQNNSTLVAGNMVITGTNGDTLTLQGVTTLPGSTDFLFV